MTSLSALLSSPVAKWAHAGSGLVESIRLPLSPDEYWAETRHHHKRLIVTAGLYGAGTTWTHNVLLGALKARGLGVHATYAESIGLPLLYTLRRNDALLVKAHVLQPKAVTAVNGARAPLLIPIRDPRDAVASLMSRFGFAFEKAFNLVARSAANILDVQLGLPHTLFKYEDGFMNRLTGVEDVTRVARLDLTQSEAGLLYESLLPARVKQAIAAQDRIWSDYDPQTHWHKNHVGDGKIGKFRERFDAEQRRILDERFALFLDRFSYAA